MCILTLVKNRKNHSSSTNQVETANISNLNNTYTTVNFQNVNLLVDVFQKFDVSSTDCEKYYASVLLKGKSQTFEVDSGAGLTLLPKCDFNRLNLHATLLSTIVRFKSYTRNVFEPLGMVQIPVRYKNVESEEILFVILN